MGPRVCLGDTRRLSVLMASCRRCASKTPYRLYAWVPVCLGDTRRLCVSVTRCRSLCASVYVVTVLEPRRPGPRVSPAVCVRVCVSARAPRRRWIRSVSREPDPGPTTRRRRRSPGLPLSGPGRGWSCGSLGRGAQRPEARAASGAGGGGPRGGSCGLGGRAPARPLPRALSPSPARPPSPPPPAASGPPSPGTERARSGAGLASSQQRHGTSPPPLSFSPGEFLGWCVGSRRKLPGLGGLSGGGTRCVDTPPTPATSGPQSADAPSPRLGAELAGGAQRGPQVGGPSWAPRS